MTFWRGYFAAQRLVLGDPNWAQLQALFETWGPLNDPQPASMMQVLPNLAADVVIYEAMLNTDNVSIAGFRQALADEFGIDPGDIGVTAGDQTFLVIPSPFWTFDYAGQNRFRAGVFGGLSSTWPESRDECDAYKIAAIATWQTEGL